MKQSDQSGFAAIEALLILVIVAIIGGTGYFVWHAKRNTETALDNAASSKSVAASKLHAKKTDSYAGWNTYTAQLGNFTMKYPMDWTVERNESHNDPQANPDEVFKLKSPSGLELLYTFSDYTDTSVVPPSDFFSCGHQSACTTYHVYSIDKFNSGSRFGQMYLTDYSSSVRGVSTATVDSYSINMYRPVDLKNMPQVGDNNPENQGYSFDSFAGTKQVYYFLVSFPETMNVQSAKQVFSSNDAKIATQILESFQAN